MRFLKIFLLLAVNALLVPFYGLMSA